MVESKLKHRHVSGAVVFVHASKSLRRFRRLVLMPSIVLAWPSVLVGENTGLLVGLFDENFLEGLFLRVSANPETGPSSFATDHAHDERPVVLVGPSSALLVGFPARGII